MPLLRWRVRVRGGGGRGTPKGCYEEGCEDKVDDASTQDRGVNAPLGEEDHSRYTEGELLEYSDGHDRPEADRIAGHDDEQDLPREGHADEAVEMLRMGDRRWEVAADLGLHEVLGRKNEDAVHRGGQEHATSE